MEGWSGAGAVTLIPAPAIAQPVVKRVAIHHRHRQAPSGKLVQLPANIDV